MKLTFKEACSAVADLYEAAPETYAKGGYLFDERGNMVSYSGDGRDRAVSWCAVGGVLLAMDCFTAGEVENLLYHFTPGGFPFKESDRSRTHAIALLRRASGELA